MDIDAGPNFKSYMCPSFHGPPGSSTTCLLRFPQPGQKSQGRLECLAQAVQVIHSTLRFIEAKLTQSFRRYRRASHFPSGGYDSQKVNEQSGQSIFSIQLFCLCFNEIFETLGVIIDAESYYLPRCCNSSGSSQTNVTLSRSWICCRV